MKKVNSIWFFLLIAFGFVLLFNNGCKKENDNNNNPPVTVTDIDGNIYHTVTIGSQVWMVENLKTTRFRNGDTISNISIDWMWPSYSESNYGIYGDYDNVPGNSTTYGKLYSFNTVNDSRNIAPTGWHVPSDAEWQTLITFLGGESIAGSKLKETGNVLWLTPNAGATNESGFAARPGGRRTSYDGTFELKGEHGYWWSSTEDISNPGNVWARKMNYDNSDVENLSMSTGWGFSVRCVKD